MMMRLLPLCTLMVAVTVVCSAGAMSPEALVRSYTDTLAKQEKFAFKFTDRTVTTAQILVSRYGKPLDEKPRNYTRYTSGEVITDGRRLAVSRNRWGYHGRDIVASNPMYDTDTFDGRQRLRYEQYPQETDKPLGHVLFDPNPKHDPMRAAIWTENVLSLLGYIYVHRMRIDDVLRDPSTKLVVRKERENIGGEDCHVLDVSSLYGRGTLWLDPEHGYNIAQAHFSHRTGDVSKINNKPITEPWESHFYWKDMTFTLVDSVWFPTQGTFEYNIDCQRFWEKTAHHVKITEVQLNPDMDAMDAFSTDHIPDGAPCGYIGQHIPVGSSSPYIWQGGRVIPAGRN